MEPDDHPTADTVDQAEIEVLEPGSHPEGDPAVVPYVPTPYSGWLALGIPLARPIESRLPMPPDTPFSMPPALSRLRAIIEIILVVPAALVGAVMGYTFVSGLQPADERWLGIGDSMGLGCGAALGCMLIVWLGHGRMSTIGLTARNLVLDVCLGITSLFGVYMGLVCATLGVLSLDPALLNQRSAAQQAIETNIPRLSMGGIVALCLFVAIYEEVVFRGFLLTRLHAIVRRRWAAVPLGAVVFGGLHVYEGFLAVGVVTFLGLVMGLLFLWRKSLAAPITLHLFHNLFMFSLLRVVSETWK
jgi:membrane protease YdiL (CAAX protease family)